MSKLLFGHLVPVQQALSGGGGGTTLPPGGSDGSLLRTDGAGTYDWENLILVDNAQSQVRIATSSIAGTSGLTITTDSSSGTTATDLVVFQLQNTPGLNINPWRGIVVKEPTVSWTGTQTNLHIEDATRGSGAKFSLVAMGDAALAKNLLIGGTTAASTIRLEVNGTAKGTGGGTATDILVALDQHASQSGDVLRVLTSTGTVQWRVEGGQGGSTCIGGSNLLASSVSSRVRIVGANTSASSYALVVQDSTPNNMFRINNANGAMFSGTLNVGVDAPANDAKMEVSGTFLAGGTDDLSTTSGVYIGSTANSTGVTLSGVSRGGVGTQRQLWLNNNGHVVGILTSTPSATSALHVAHNNTTAATDSGVGTGTEALKVVQAATIVTSPGNANFRTVAGELFNTSTRTNGTGIVTNVGVDCKASGAQKNRGLIVTAGMVTLTSANITVADGVNDDIGEPGSSFIRLVGPTAGFSITSVRGGSAASTPPQSGDIVILYNTTTQNMTITNTAGTGTAANRITTSTGADLVTAGTGYVILIYDATLANWRDIGFGA